jgi:hypothetical protein
MSGGNWMQTLITLVGGRDLLCGQDAHSPFLSCESLLNADPAAIVIAPCGFDIDRTLHSSVFDFGHKVAPRLKSASRGSDRSARARLAAAVEERASADLNRARRSHR